jgi:hypothetical protein
VRAGDHRILHHTTNIVSELNGIVLGPVYDRLRPLGIGDPGDNERIIENLTGRPAPQMERPGAP